MCKFEIGNEIEIVKKTLGYNGVLKIGDTAVIKEFQGKSVRFVKLKGDEFNDYSWHDVENIKLVNEWSIYNNTIPWSKLSDKQKGEILLAAHNKVNFSGFGINVIPKFVLKYQVYQAVRPEPTMETVFANDWFNECGQSPKNMIDKGWVKPS
jgi:hypothetical protein